MKVEQQIWSRSSQSIFGWCRRSVVVASGRQLLLTFRMCMCVENRELCVCLTVSVSCVWDEKLSSWGRLWVRLSVVDYLGGCAVGSRLQKKLRVWSYSCQQWLLHALLLCLFVNCNSVCTMCKFLGIGFDFHFSISKIFLRPTRSGFWIRSSE